MRLNIVFRLVPILLGLVGCVEENSQDPKIPKGWEPTYKHKIHLEPDYRYEAELEQRERNRQEMLDSMVENAHLQRISEHNNEVCTYECSAENEKRLTLREELMGVRKQVEKICTDRTKYMVTSEDSPTARNRIVENEVTGKLEYRERRIDVVRLDSGWDCPKKLPEGLGSEHFTFDDVAKHWMNDMPKKVAIRPCGMIRDAVSMRNIDLEACLKWVHDGL